MSSNSSHPEAVGDQIRSHARKLLAAATADMRATGAGHSVHGVRRHLKRLRSLLRLVAPAIGQDAYDTADKHLKTAADLLAGARRAEALRLAASRLANKPGDASRLVAAIDAHTKAHAAPDNRAAALQEALTLIDMVRREAAQWHLPKAGIGFYLAGLRRSYAKARKGLARSLKDADVDRLHEARKHVIHTLHHMELLGALWPDVKGLPLDELNLLREALGDFNDLAELCAIATPGALAGKASHKRVHAVLTKAKAKLLRRAKKKARRLFARKPGTFAGRIGAMWETALG